MNHRRFQNRFAIGPQFHLILKSVSAVRTGGFFIAAREFRELENTEIPFVFEPDYRGKQIRRRHDQIFRRIARKRVGETPFSRRKKVEK